MREEGLLCRSRERAQETSEQMRSERRNDGLLYLGGRVPRDRLAVSIALLVGTSSMDLQIRIWLGSVQEATLRCRISAHARVDWCVIGIGQLLDLLRSKSLRFWRIQVDLASLEMLDLTSRVLCANVAAVQAPYFVALLSDQYVGGGD